jgi:hypothetical protein
LRSIDDSQPPLLVGCQEEVHRSYGGMLHGVKAFFELAGFDFECQSEASGMKAFELGQRSVN